MKPRHQVPQAAVELVERFEGYRRKAAQLPDGRWTIGYGHTLTAREDAEVSAADAEALLIYDLMAVAETVEALVFTPLNANQFAALTAFAFNVGAEAFRASEVLKRVNEGALIQAACAMELWRRADFDGERILVDGLVRRRAAEKALFLTPPDGDWTPVPSAIVRPQRDEGAGWLVPAEPPTPLATPLDGTHAVAVREPLEETPVPPPSPPHAPDEADAEDSPLRAAAEAVTARLSTIFLDEPTQAAAEPQPEPEPDSEPADIPAAEPAEEPEPFELTAPQLEAETASDLAAEPELDPEPQAVPGEIAPDLFDQPEPANDPDAVAAELLPPAEPAPPEPGAERVVIDDTAPFEFVPPRVAPLPQKSADGYLSMLVLAVLGLAFLAGGLFWAVNAQPGLQPNFLSPRVVGALASVAGIGLLSVDVYLFLQRLGRAAERDADDSRN